ncbi:MAG: glycosyltransferase, partial [Trueperaceae bacterium]|nr:glycosyltransferase [Trueperaceae bacterium]
MDGLAWDVIGWAMAVAVVLWVAIPAWWWWGLRRVPVRSPRDPRGVDGELPALALVVAARDEAGTPADAAALARAVRSWRALEYPNLEIVVVDDRSSDATAAVLAGAFEGDPRARVVRADEPPAGWLGKVHALAVGAAATKAPWLLFTDADVVLHPAAARVALAWAARDGLDHVAYVPRFVAHGPWLRGFVAAFTLLLTLLTRPWLARDPRSRHALGIGAFGLYRRAALERAGGLAAVRARPDDDLALARALKAAGGRTAVAFAPELASVVWYPTLRAALSGLEKNAFAAVGYRPVVALLAVAALLATHVAPFLAPFVGPPSVRAAGIGVVACALLAYAAHGRRAGHAAWLGLLHPVSVVLLVFALTRST